MKKILFLFASVLSLGAYSQMQVFNMHDNTMMAPNDTVYFVTYPDSVLTRDFDLKNTSSTTNRYLVKRYDLVLTAAEAAYFCFGGLCYPWFTYTSTQADTLDAGQKASQRPGDYKILSADLVEGPVIGKSYVKYTFFRETNVNDSVQINVKYNYTQPVGIKETSKTLSSFEIFPNPAKDMATLKINSLSSFESKLVVYNALGETVYQKDVSISEGKNKIELNVDHLPSGVYFATIKNGNTSLNKRLVVE